MEMNEYWRQSLRKSRERETFFTEKRPNEKLAGWARQSQEVASDRLAGGKLKHPKL